MGVTFHSKHLDPPYSPSSTCWNTRNWGQANYPLVCNLAPTLTTMFQTLCDAYPAQANYISVGKTINNRDIWLYRIGNPNGGCVLWDGCTHGWEDIGAEVQYLIANWLLTSGEQKAQELLQTNYILFIPDVNPDSLERGNANLSNGATYGVDLNRNYVTGFTYIAPPGTSNLPYHGASGGSELETQAMRGVFQTYKPKVYVNCHYGGGPYLQYCNSNEVATWIRNRIAQLDPAFPWNISLGTAIGGMAVADAVSIIGNDNVSAWLWEVATNAGAPYKTGSGSDAYMHNAQTLADIQTWYFPKMLPAFIAMCEAVATSLPQTFNLTINLSGGKGYTQPQATGTTVAYPSGMIVEIAGYGNTVSPVDGSGPYMLDHWILDGVAVGLNGSPNPIQITMDRDHILDIVCVLAPATRKVTITSIPEINAKVYIDGVNVGNTPFSTDLSVGIEHTIGIEPEVTT